MRAITALCTSMGFSSTCQFAGAGLLPIDKQKPAGRVELRLAWAGKDLQLQLVDFVLRAIPTRDCEIAGPPRVRQQHDVHHRVVGHERAVLVEVTERPQRDGAVDRRHQRRVHLRDAVVVQPEDHTAEARVVRHVFRLHAVEHELPAGAVLGGELRNAVHGIAHCALVPCGEGECAGGRYDVVRVRAILDLRLESFTLVAERLKDRCSAVREWKRSWKDLNDGSAAGHLDRRRSRLHRVRFSHRRAAIAPPGGHRVAVLCASLDPQPCVHAELLVRVLADGAIHLVGPGLEGKRQRGPCARLDDLGLLLDSLPLNFERVWDAARVHDGERHYAGSDTAFREFDFPRQECVHSLFNAGDHDSREPIPAGINSPAAESSSEGERLDSPELERFETVVLPHLDAAYTLARYLMRNDHDAEDVVQDAYLRALKYFSGFRGEESSARAWVLAIVRNTAYTWRRRQHSDTLGTEFNEELHSDSVADEHPEAALIKRDAGASLTRALDQLPIEFREVIVLRELEGLSYKEISDVAGVPVGTVMSRLSRARQRLQEALCAAEEC